METNETKNFVDAILGTGEDLHDELANAILKLHSIDEHDLTADFKAALRERLSLVPEESKEAHNLRRTLSNVVRYEKETSPDFARPKHYVRDIMNEVQAAFPKPVYSFRNRSEGAMSQNDEKILSELAKELDQSEGDDVD